MKKCPKCGKKYEDTTTLCPADGAVLAKTDDGLVGQTLADKYRVEERISEGGMGTVYRGTHILMDKTVAIKVLHPALAADDVIVARFSREARAASRISHPHALNVTDFGESENGVVFLIMEYLRGRTLKEVVHSDAPMPLSRVVEIVRQVSGALEAAHAEGVVHRDLKSDNIMLVEVGDNNSDWAKVLDFGIAKIQEPVGQDPALTAPNLIIGTPQYMSPEQCSQASEIDSRSDIYSLGVILYEMLVGHVPFTGESPTAIMMKHLQEAPPSVLDERKDLPAEVSRVVARALAKRPEDRFKSASELSQSLALAAEGEVMRSSASAAAAPTNATTPDAPDRDTNRIVATTGPNEPPRGTADEDYDESTIVQGRKEEARPYATQPMRSEPAPPPADSFNPWRILVPALVGLIVVFGVIYALTRNSAQPSSNQSNTPLVVDPGSQAVQPQPPPTGQGEQNINSSTPTTTATTGTSASTSGTSGTNQNRNSDDASANENANNSNRGNKNQQNENTENQNGADNTPNQNSNQGEDTRPVDDTLPPVDDDAPPPMATPTPRRRRPPKPVDSPPTPAPQESPSGASGLTPSM